MIGPQVLRRRLLSHFEIPGHRFLLRYVTSYLQERVELYDTRQRD